MTERIVIVTGSRIFDEAKLLNEALDLCQPTRVVQGGAKGADELAKLWALTNEVACTTVRADWDKHGRAAGHLRNGKMLRMFPDALIVLAFPRGEARGTHNCIEQARALGLDVEVL